MPELASALVAACLLLFIAVLELPTTLAISIRQNDSGFRLETVIGLFWGVLPFRAISVSVASEGWQASKGLLDLLRQVLCAALEHVRATGTRRSSWRRRMLGLALGAAENSVGKPGYSCTRFGLHMNVGLSDASHTALATGLVYASLGALTSPFGRLMRFASGISPEVVVTPSYEAVGLTLAIDCIFRISLGYIIRREAARLLRRRFASGKVA